MCGKYLLFHKLTSHRKKVFGERVRLACEELGPTFIKMGQLLSLRYDILDAADSKELHKLLDGVPPFSYRVAREIIKHDLGGYPEKLFKKFDTEPFASASISQVHKAVLHDGTKVAVKVRRPWIGKPIEQDIKIIRRFITVLQVFSPTLRKLRAVTIVDELHSALLKEIDFRHEASNLEKARKYYGKYTESPVRPELGHIIFPTLYTEFSSYNVLTTEFLSGVTLKDYSDIIGDPQYDIKKSVSTVINGCVREMFNDSHYFFHADPHPANLIIMKNGDIGLIDFGIVGEFDERFTQRANDLFFAVYARNTELVIDNALKLTGTTDKNYRERIRRDVEEYLENTCAEGIGYWFLGVAKIFAKHGIPFPRELTMLGRSNLIMDGLLHMVDPEKTTLDIIGPELKRGIKKRMIKNITNADYFSILYNLTEKVKRNPASFNKAIDRYAEDPLLIIRDIKKELV